MGKGFFKGLTKVGKWALGHEEWLKLLEELALEALKKKGK